MAKWLNLPKTKSTRFQKQGQIVWKMCDFEKFNILKKCGIFQVWESCINKEFRLVVCLSGGRPCNIFRTIFLNKKRRRGAVSVNEGEKVVRLAVKLKF